MAAVKSLLAVTIVQIIFFSFGIIESILVSLKTFECLVL